MDRDPPSDSGEVETWNYEWDGSGQLIGKQKATDVAAAIVYRYGPLGMLEEVVSDQGTTRYEYDALGRRVGRTFESQETQYLVLKLAPGSASSSPETAE